MPADILQHTECPGCRAPNLTTEPMCFACGAGLRARAKRRRGEPPPAVPWTLYLGLALVLLVAALVGSHLVRWLAGYRVRAAFPLWYLPVGGGILIAVGQLAFLDARRRDRRWWRLQRAPKLKLSQANVGDDVWLRGRLGCDTPLVAPYTDQQCAYYRYLLREREPGQSGWRETERGGNAVDFRLVEDDESVYVPSGPVLFDAPLYLDNYLDPSGTIHVRVWALPVGLPVSLCGLLAGETSRPGIDPLGDALPVIATWRLPDDYINLVARRVRAAHMWAWALTILGGIALIAGIVRV